MGHSCAVASASAKPQSTCPLHGAAVSDLPGVRVPHQLPWVPPGCGNDPQPLSQHDVAGKWQPVDLASSPSLWPMRRVTDSPMRWEQKHRVLLRAQAVRWQRSLPCPPLLIHWLTPYLQYLQGLSIFFFFLFFWCKGAGRCGCGQCRRRGLYVYQQRPNCY